MRLVGATNGFIQKPFLIKGLYQGVYSSIFAIFMLIGAIKLVEGDTANMLNIDDLKIIGMVFLLMFLSGLILSLFSTFFAVRKYIKINEILNKNNFQLVKRFKHGFGEFEDLLYKNKTK